MIQISKEASGNELMKLIRYSCLKPYTEAINHFRVTMRFRWPISRLFLLGILKKDGFEMLLNTSAGAEYIMTVIISVKLLR